MDPSEILKHYAREDVRKEIVFVAKNREVVGSFGGKGYARRPDIIEYENDVYELAKQGITSFHMSEEIWENPLNITLEMSKKEVEDLRIGWDLILDIDCKWLEYSQIAAHYLIEALKYHSIKSASCKFSGNHGFHIGVPFECFPETVNKKETKSMFPDAPRAIAMYLTNMIREHLANAILKNETLEDIKIKTGFEEDKLVLDGKFDPFSILEIDTILISSRHLCRMPYSINEKSGWVSVPINPSEVLNFDTISAKIENVKVNEYRFLDRTNVICGEGKQLLVQALDYAAKKNAEVIFQEDMKNTTKREFEDFSEAVPEQHFPPCIQLIFKGLKDGKKRAIFVLVNFLNSVGWSYEQIEDRLKEWNKQNLEPLREVYIKGQIRYHKSNKKKILPPNCDNEMYYKGFGCCKPDNLCGKIKNPVNYVRRKVYYSHNNDDNKKKQKKVKKSKEKDL